MTHGVVAFGPLAQHVARRLPPLDVDVLVVDERGALDAVPEAARRYLHGMPFHCMLLLDDESAVTMRALSPLILQRAGSADQCRALLESAAAGTLTIDGRPQRDILRRDDTPRRAMGCVLRLADGLLVRSRQEALRVSHACQQEVPASRLIRLSDANVAEALRLSDANVAEALRVLGAPIAPDAARGAARSPHDSHTVDGVRTHIVLWAPEWRAEQLGMWWTVLEFIDLPVVAVCASGTAASPRVRVVGLQDAAQALRMARVIIDTATADPTAAQALAACGVPLLAAASSGAEESVAGVFTYYPSQYASMGMALRRALAGPRAESGYAMPAVPAGAPLVSVVMPTRNRPTMLRRALDSVRRATWPEVEVVVVNDGGDDVSAVLADFPFARLITHEQTRGVSAARNTALDAVRGAYVGFLDDDDIHLPFHLQACVRALERGGGDVVNTAHVAVFVERDADGVLWARSLYVHDALFDGLAMHVWQPVLVQGVFARAHVLRHLRFDPSLPVAEDYEFLIRLGRASVFAYLPRPSWMITVYDGAGSLSTSDRYADALRRIYAMHPLDGSAVLEAERKRQIEQNEQRGGRKAPWLPTLGHWGQACRLSDLDGFEMSPWMAPVTT